MNRSKDLDTIAPDDPILETTETTDIFNKEPPKFPKKNRPPKKEEEPKTNQKIYTVHFVPIVLKKNRFRK